MKRTILIFNLIVLFFLFTSCKVATVYTKSIFAMSTYIDVTIYNAPEEHLHKIASIYNSYSTACDMFKQYEGNLCDLNTRRSIEVDDRLLEIIEFSLEIEKELDGYFNILIGRITKIWKEALHIGDDFSPIILPSDELIQSELKIMDESKIIIEDNIVTIEGDADIDLGAVAKGYATLKVEEYMKENNITSYIINAGESNISLGYKNIDDSYLVGLLTVDRMDYFQYIKLNNKAVVTSSIAQQYRIIDNNIYTHIINPLTGYPATNYDIITIIGSNSGLLDVLSTALFCMDLDKIKEYVNDNDLGIYIVKDEEIIYKEGVESYEKI